MMEMKCDKCKSNTFAVEIKSECDTCVYNGWYCKDVHMYKYDNPGVGDVRDQAYQDGECNMGTNFNAGCYLFKCTVCGNDSHLPTCER